MNLSESLLRLRQHSSSLFRTVDSSTSSQAPGPTIPLDHHSNEPSHSGDSSATSRLANDQPRRTSASTAPPRVEAIEYQWSEELVADLLALPPRSRYVGKFSIVADPAVNNSTRAHLFARQLHARAVPISDYSQLTSSNAGSSNSCSFVSYCTCQEGCQGRFVVSADDDSSHPYGVPGQRIGVVVVHPNPPD
ncbi:hypothetical protein BGY98DRAFT_1098640 [Russula aff. rugulosa BPL654]|nr:hypothetical protein BGY98DRAFT_1098640 [Russula aff. rugulosa BPL654]